MATSGEEMEGRTQGTPEGPRPEATPAWWWDLVLLAALAGIALATAFLPAVTQPPEYHIFADHRRMVGVPNALDVLSNAAFAIVGIAGLLAALRPGAFADRRARPAWVVLFAAVTATAVGSVYYHLAPTSPRLVWDRLPIAVGFMALVAALAGDRFGAAAGRWLLPRLVLAGAGSVGWWWLGDGAGQGNLLPYLAVQYGSLAAIPLMLVGPGWRAGPRAPWLLALALYVAAKLLELADGPVFALVGVSGHTLKHLVAAAAIGVLALRVRGYRPAGAAAGGGGGRGARSSMLEKSFGGTNEGSAFRT